MRPEENILMSLGSRFRVRPNREAAARHPCLIVVAHRSSSTLGSGQRRCRESRKLGLSALAAATKSPTDKSWGDCRYSPRACWIESAGGGSEPSDFTRTRRGRGRAPWAAPRSVGPAHDGSGAVRALSRRHGRQSLRRLQRAGSLVRPPINLLLIVGAIRGARSPDGRNRVAPNRLGTRSRRYRC
jgi:hypothetical protein